MLEVLMNTRRGFTLVEILLAMTVIGILVTIGVVSWGSYTTWSQNKSRESELNTWKSTFELYKSRFAVYPTPSTSGTFCLGNDFSGGVCGLNGNRSQDTTLITALQRVTTMPSNPHPKVGQSGYLGPLVRYDGASTLTIIGIFAGTSSNCPSGTTYDTTSPGSGVVYCNITLAL